VPNPRLVPELTAFIVQYRESAVLPLEDDQALVEEHLLKVQQSEQLVNEL
jgi:hypothetical protein